MTTITPPETFGNRISIEHAKQHAGGNLVEPDRRKLFADEIGRSLVEGTFAARNHFPFCRRDGQLSLLPCGLDLVITQEFLIQAQVAAAARTKYRIGRLQKLQGRNEPPGNIAAIYCRGYLTGNRFFFGH